MKMSEIAMQGWLMNQLGIGPGIGEVHYLRNNADTYGDWLRDDLKVDPYFIHTTLARAYAHLTAGRNDVICVTPGAPLESAGLAWDKANSHLVGMSGPNSMGDFYEPQANIYTTGIAVATVINVTGQNSQFINSTINYYGNNAACLSALILNNYGCIFKNSTLMGNMLANQNSTAAAASLYIGTSGHYPILENCQIIQRCQQVETRHIINVPPFF